MSTKLTLVAAPRSPKAIAAEIAALEPVVDGHFTALKNAIADLKADNNLCERCGGKGGWRYRPTLDYMHEYEWETCKECDGVDRASSLEESLALPPDEAADAKKLQELRAEFAKSQKLADGDWLPANSRYTPIILGDQTPRCHLLKGMVCTVYRGRKVKVGTTGQVFWSGIGSYGDRVGLRVDGQADPVWVDARNVRPVWVEELGVDEV